MSKMSKDARADMVREMRARHSSRASVRPAAPTPVQDKAFGKLSLALSKKYKGEVFTTIANGTRASSIDAVPSGWRELDDLVTGETDRDAKTVAGSGLGWPRGRIIEIFGDEGVGKTSLALHIIVAVQGQGERCAFVDAEHALDVSYAAKLGVDLAKLVLNQPDRGGEQALDIVTSLCESKLFGCVVVDSVAALTPLAELELDLEDSAQPGGHARLMSRALRKLASIVRKTGTILVFLNQTRMKIGIKYGNPKTTTGGNALKFYASVRFEMVVVKTKKRGDRVQFRRTRIRAVKNKVAPPFRDVFADVYPNRGIVDVHGDPDLGEGSDDD